MGLFSGLEKFGLKSGNVNLYEDDQKKKETKGNVTKTITEEDMIFDKSYECLVCGATIKTKMVKSKSAKSLGTDIDLRPKYQGIDPLKYDAISCSVCGYAALTPYFANITDPQIRLIKENISKNYQGKPENTTGIFTYDDAIEKHKLALFNAIVKKSKASEKAFICLKTAWLTRGKSESLDKNAPDYNEQLEALHEEELECLKEACNGFVNAMSSETSSKICNMELETVEYLCSAIAYKLGDLSSAKLHLSRAMPRLATNRVLQNKAVELKELIVEASKK